MTRYAETWLDIGRLPLRRRDREAMALALSNCRNPDGGACLDALGCGGMLARDIERAFHCGPCARWDVRVARLALLLRVLLRVDAGDYGARERWLQCDRCFRVERDLESLAAAQGVCVPYPRNGSVDCAPGSHAPGLLSPMRWPLPPIRRVAPLWEATR